VAGCRELVRLQAASAKRMLRAGRSLEVEQDRGDPAARPDQARATLALFDSVVHSWLASRRHRRHADRSATASVTAAVVGGLAFNVVGLGRWSSLGRCSHHLG
jgi:hypothetical protein